MIEYIRRNQSGVLLVLLLSISFSCITLRIDPYIVGIKSIVWYLVSPQVVYTGEFFNKLDTLRGRIFRLFHVEGENYILRQQISELAKRDAERDALEAENNRLRQLLDLNQRQFPDAISAEVIGRDPRDWFHAVVINGGQSKGVVDSAAVVTTVAEKPALVGRIMEVSDGTSKVLLMTDAVSAISVVVPNRGDIGLLEGRNKPWMLLNYLSPNSEVAPGDEVVSKGLGGVFPPGIPIGLVSSVRVTPDGYFKTAQVIPHAGLNSLTEVSVLQRKEIKEPAEALVKK